jgi:hypothetical protein
MSTTTDRLPPRVKQPSKSGNSLTDSERLDAIAEHLKAIRGDVRTFRIFLGILGVAALLFWLGRWIGH